MIRSASSRTTPDAARPAAEGTDRRVLIMVVIGSLLPLLVYVLINLALTYREQQRATAAATLTRAAHIMEAIDARLDTTAATLRAVTTMRSIRDKDWSRAYGRAFRLARLDPDWRSVTLIDLETGTEIFDLRRPLDAARPIDLRALAAVPLRTGRPSFSGVVRGPDGRFEIDAFLAVAAPSRPRYLVKVALDPMLAQRILLELAPRDGASAVIDRHSRFIARTLAWQQRLGSPATRYAQNAVARQRSGFYRGVTFEGFANYTGYVTSPRTGWSAHVAVSATLIDDAHRGSRLSALLAAAVSILIALAIAFTTIRTMRQRRATRLRLQQAERLETVGQLTGGVAHDFNNMLAIVIASLDMAQRRLADGHTDIGRYIRNAMDGAQRAADLTGRLLAFSRRQPLAPSLLDVNALIEGMRELLRSALTENIEIVFDLAAEMWPTFADAGQVENALVNLAVNARDAMPDGGRLTIATACRTIGRDIHQLAPGDYVVVSVTDDGAGMLPDVLARAFEPFYTTKEIGRGTGLGLSQIHGFATQSGGTVTLRSALGAGTTVAIYLPRAARDVLEPARAMPRAAGPSQASGPGSELVLLVEDDDRVRQVNEEALLALGYRVIAARRADEACRILAGRTDIGLVLSDIVMPGMSGRDLADHVRHAYPHVPVLLVSGYDQQQGGNDVDLLRKPFSLDQLARRIRHLLDGGHRPGS